MAFNFRAKNKNEIPVNPNTLNVIQSSVLKLRHAASLAIAEVMNIATQSQLIARHPCAVKLICLPIIAANGLRPNNRPPAIKAANNKVTTVGLILIKSSLSKYNVRPAKNTKAAQPTAAINEICRSKYQLKASDTSVAATKTFTLNIRSL